MLNLSRVSQTSALMLSLFWYLIMKKDLSGKLDIEMSRFWKKTRVAWWSFTVKPHQFQLHLIKLSGQETSSSRESVLKMELVREDTSTSVHLLFMTANQSRLELIQNSLDLLFVINLLLLKVMVQPAPFWPRLDQLIQKEISHYMQLKKFKKLDLNRRTSESGPTSSTKKLKVKLKLR